MSWAERKAERTKHYKRFVFGWKQVTCVACNGSGRYDNRGSPRCSSCGGSGKVKVSPEAYAAAYVDPDNGKRYG